MRREFILDGNNFHDEVGFCRETTKLLTRNLPWTPRAGRFLDAFNDYLRGGFGLHEYGDPITIRWVNSQKSRADLGYPETVERYKAILSHCYPSDIDYYTAKLNAAAKGEGETVFDIICKMIVNTDNTGHDCVLVLE